MAGRHSRPSRAQARAGAYALQRQAGSARVRAERKRRALGLAKRAGGATAAATGALAVGVLAVGGTYALWTDGEVLDSGTILSGSAGLAVDPGAISALNLLPGEVHGQTIDLASTGNAVLEVSALIDQLSTGFEVRLAIDYANCGAVPIGGAALDDATPSVLGTLEGWETVELCVEVTALPSLLPEEEIEFEITLNGAQVP